MHSHLYLIIQAFFPVNFLTRMPSSSGILVQGTCSAFRYWEWIAFYAHDWCDRVHRGVLWNQWKIWIENL